MRPDDSQDERDRAPHGRCVRAVVSQEAAEQAALEIEITRPDGSEVDVLIAPDGSIID